MIISWGCPIPINMNKYLRIIFVLASILVFVFLMRQINLYDVIERSRTIGWVYVLGSFLVYAIINVLRAYRFFCLAGKVVSGKKFFYIIGIQNFLSVVFPFRLGELSYVYLLHKEGKVSIGKNIATLVASRVLDLLSIILIFLLALVSVNRVVNFPLPLILFGVTILVLIAALSVTLIYYGEYWNKTIHFISYKLHLSQLKVFVKCVSKVDSVIDGFSDLRRKQALFTSLSTSIVIWFLSFVGGYLLLLGVGIRIGFWPSIFAYAMPLFVSMTPFMSFGGFGSYEGSLVFGLFLFGLSGPAVIVDSLLIHLADLCFVLSLAGLVTLFKKFLFAGSLLVNK